MVKRFGFGFVGFAGWKGCLVFVICWLGCVTSLVRGWGCVGPWPVRWVLFCCFARLRFSVLTNTFLFYLFVARSDRLAVGWLSCVNAVLFYFIDALFYWDRLRVGWLGPLDCFVVGLVRFALLGSHWFVVGLAVACCCLLHGGGKAVLFSCPCCCVGRRLR